MPRRILSFGCVLGLAVIVSCSGDDDPDNNSNSAADEGVVDDAGADDTLPCADPKTYYRDEDGDSYGALFDSIQACSQPEGYVTNNLDCADGDPNAFPGQESFFNEEISGDTANTWDYNCDGVAEPSVLYTDAIICENKGYNICETIFEPSWYGTEPPACGETAKIVVSCTLHGGPLNFTCDANFSGEEQQPCR